MPPTKFRCIWASGFREEDFFRNQPVRNKNCLWWPCLLTDQDKMSNLYRGPSIDASYQVSLYLTEGFQRRRLKCEKLTDDGRQVMAKAHIMWAKNERYWSQKINKSFKCVSTVPHWYVGWQSWWTTLIWVHRYLKNKFKRNWNKWCINKTVHFKYGNALNWYNEATVQML